MFFFSRVNSGIRNGGMAGESKYEILQLLPSSLVPKSVLVPKSQMNALDIESLIKKHQFSYPVIFKPDVGNRGFLVEIIHSTSDIEEYVAQVNADIIIQEYIDFPIEYGVFYYRYPDKSKGVISSVCLKELLQVTGDGKSSIRSLMMRSSRSRLQVERFERTQPEFLEKIPKESETVLLEPIANHSRGTKFVNASHLIDDDLIAVFDKISHQTSGILYGRLYIRCRSIEDLKKGQHFMIMECNGVASEVAHIYDPSFSLIKAYFEIYKHWKVMYEISKMQRKKGVPSITFGEAWRTLRSYFKHRRSAGLAS